MSINEQELNLALEQNQDSTLFFIVSESLVNRQGVKNIVFPYCVGDDQGDFFEGTYCMQIDKDKIYATFQPKNKLRRRKNKMRYRICDHVFNYTDSEENDIYRKFKYQFDNLLNADEVPKNDTDFEDMYVPDKDFKNDMCAFLQMYSNSILCQQAQILFS